MIVEEGKKVGIICVDPTSPLTGGALLGDRIRMKQHYLFRYARIYDCYRYAHRIISKDTNWIAHGSFVISYCARRSEILLEIFHFGYYDD